MSWDHVYFALLHDLDSVIISALALTWQRQGVVELASILRICSCTHLWALSSLGLERGLDVARALPDADLGWVWFSAQSPLMSFITDGLGMGET